MSIHVNFVIHMDDEGGDQAIKIKNLNCIRRCGGSTGTKCSSTCSSKNHAYVDSSIGGPPGRTKCECFAPNALPDQDCACPANHNYNTAGTVAAKCLPCAQLTDTDKALCIADQRCTWLGGTSGTLGGDDDNEWIPDGKCWKNFVAVFKRQCK